MDGYANFKPSSNYISKVYENAFKTNEINFPNNN